MRKHSAVGLSYLEDRARQGVPLLVEDGQPLSCDEVVRRVQEARSQGLEVWPPCDKTSEKGRCLGHE